MCVYAGACVCRTGGCEVTICEYLDINVCRNLGDSDGGSCQVERAVEQ